jgi:bifunctional non-homologous end joining protein LigD
MTARRTAPSARSGASAPRKKTQAVAGSRALRSPLSSRARGESSATELSGSGKDDKQPKSSSSAVKKKPPGPRDKASKLVIPERGSEVEVAANGRSVTLTNLEKPFWPKLQITKGDLLRYYQAVAPVLLPHLHDRAMVMKRYPNGAGGEFFFMKRAPTPHPEWLTLCAVPHASGNVIDFPVIQDLASLLWVVNLGCIDLNPWYARCDDVNRPDFLHFDLDPVPGADFKRVRETALAVREMLDQLGMQSYAKTSGSKGIHVYVPIERGPTQKEVWTVAKTMAQTLATLHPALITAEYRISKRPRGRVLVDYNQNAWGRTLASLYSVRPRPMATVSAPITWDEIEKGVEVENFTLQNMPERIRRVGDLWKPLLAARGRYKLRETLHAT